MKRNDSLSTTQALERFGMSKAALRGGALHGKLLRLAFLLALALAFALILPCGNAYATEGSALTTNEDPGGEIDTTTEWGSLWSAIKKAKDGDTIKVSKFDGGDNIIFAPNNAGPLQVESKNITLDLDGCTLNAMHGADAVLHVRGGSLKIVDSGSRGKITGGKRGGIVVDSGCELTMEGGVITGNSVLEDNGGGVSVGKGCTFTMKGGSITDNTATNGGGVSVGEGCTFTMKGGSITDNTATNGGGVSVYGGTFTMEGGSIANNKAAAGDNACNGGGVYVESGDFTMKDGNITSNEALNDDGKVADGGGVFVGSSGSFTMEGGSITDNKSTRIGGGVYAEPSSVFFEMTGGKISGNTAKNYGGGVAIFFTPSASVKFRVGGSPTVSGNKAADSTADDVSITTTVNPVLITKALTGGAIYISTDAEPNQRVASPEEGYQLTASDASRFFSNKDETLVGALKDGNVVFKKSLEKAKVTVTPGKAVYNGKVQNPAVTVKMGDDALTEDTDYTLSFEKDGKAVGSVKDAGTYTVVATGEGIYTGEAKSTFTVDPKQVTVSGITSPGKIYDGTTDAVLDLSSAKVEGVVGGDKLTVAKATGAYVDASAGAGKAVAITGITLGGSGAANYVLAASGQQTSAVADISRKPVTIKAKNQTVGPGGAVSSKPADVEITAGSLASGHKIAKVGITAKNGRTAGSGTVVLNKAVIQNASGKNVTANYDLTLANGVLTVKKASISKAKVTLSKASYAYDGKVKKPKVKSVVLGGKKLKAGTDYTVKYANNKNLGKATVTVTGTGSYVGSAKATFKIVLGKAKVSTVGGMAKSSFKASWKKVAGAKKYQLQYRQVGSKWKTVTVTGTSKTVKDLKSDKLYQFRVRAVAGKQAGAWSNVSKRYLRSVKGLNATVKKAGAVSVAWKADSKANAGYTVVVRYKKDGADVAKANVAKGKTKATVKGLKAVKRLWVGVRPLRTSGGKTYVGVLHGTWAKDKSGKSAKALTTQGGSLTVAQL